MIFLDVDGVLHSAEGDDQFHPACMAALQWLVTQTGAQIVLSSSWRHLGSEALQKLDAALLENSIPAVSSWTPSVDLAVERPLPRSLEIRRWLDDHPSTTDWIALDDIDLLFEPEPESSEDEDYVEPAEFSFMRGHFVRTDGAVGLSQRDAELAAQMLCASVATAE